MNHQEQIEKLSIEIKEIEELFQAIRIYDDIPPVLLRMIHEKALHIAEESLKLGDKKTPYTEPSPSFIVPTSDTSVDAVSSFESSVVDSVDFSSEKVDMKEGSLVEAVAVSESADEEEPISVMEEDDSEPLTVHEEPTKIESVDEKYDQRPDIRRLMTLNDRFLYLRELFHGDTECMNQTLDALNRQHSLEESMNFVQNRFHWDNELPGAKLFADMLERQYKDTLI